MRWVSFHFNSATGRRILGALFGVCCTVVCAQTRPLNDTGIMFCGNATSGNNLPCLGTEPAGQDKYYGRDAAALAGTLTKVGGSGGVNGFDYSKISNSGTALSPSAALGTAPSDWGCTRDNVTGLTWEIKTTSGLRNQNNSYTWYMTGSPDGNNGTSSGGVCATEGRCDTEKFVADVNAAGLCGFSAGWRMPTIKELEGIVDLGRYEPSAIDPYYFPNTPRQIFWSGTPAPLQVGSTAASWLVYFADGSTTQGSRSHGGLDPSQEMIVYRLIRLVRAGQ